VFKKLKGNIKIENETSIVHIRRELRNLTTSIGFGVTDRTRIITAASELIRNIIMFAKKGVMIWGIIENGDKKGIQLIFEDEGPGIPDINKAMEVGYSTGNGLGLGLSGTKQLMDDMEIYSEVGKGTKITVKKWLSI
jgi:serine/threonine-protein kinase RsbT